MIGPKGRAPICALTATPSGAALPSALRPYAIVRAGRAVATASRGMRLSVGELCSGPTVRSGDRDRGSGSRTSFRRPATTRSGPHHASKASPRATTISSTTRTGPHARSPPSSVARAASCITASNTGSVSPLTSASASAHPVARPARQAKTPRRRRVACAARQNPWSRTSRLPPPARNALVPAAQARGDSIGHKQSSVPVAGSLRHRPGVQRLRFLAGRGAGRLHCSESGLAISGARCGGPTVTTDRLYQQD